MDLKTIFWLAGLLEGEGSFIMNRKGSPVVQLKMTDRDVVQRVAVIFQTKIYSYYYNDSRRKEFYVTKVAGARAVGVMLTVFVLMGDRRQSRILEIIEAWKSRKHKPHKPRIYISSFT